MHYQAPRVLQVAPGTIMRKEGDALLCFISRFKVEGWCPKKHDKTSSKASSRKLWRGH